MNAHVQLQYLRASVTGLPCVLTVSQHQTIAAIALNSLQNL
jgi:hypothetical protein